MQERQGLCVLPSQLLAVVFDTFNDIEKRKFKSLLLHKRTAIQHAYRLLISQRVGRSGLVGLGFCSPSLALGSPPKQSRAGSFRKQESCLFGEKERVGFPGVSCSAEHPEWLPPRGGASWALSFPTSTLPSPHSPQGPAGISYRQFEGLMRFYKPRMSAGERYLTFKALNQSNTPLLR